MPDEAPKLSPVRGHMTLDPAGIDVFAALMHCVFAHVGNPIRGGSSEHHRSAVDYIAAHVSSGRVNVSRDSADAASACYTITHRRKPAPLQVRISVTRPAASCLEVRNTVGWVPISLADFAIRSA